MNVLTLELWRTWREERATCGFLAAGLMILATTVAALPLGIQASDPLYARIMSVAGAGLAALTLTDGLRGRGDRLGQFALLGRLPVGVSSAFVARFTFFLTGLGFFTLLGASLAVLGAGITEGKWAFAMPSTSWGWAAGLALVVSSFGFATAIWMPKSALGLPAGAFVACIALAPLLAGYFFPWMLPVSRTVAVTFLVGALSLAGIAATVAGWRSFVHASRPERRDPRSLALSGALVFLPIAPLWTWGGVGLLGPPALERQSFRIQVACVDRENRQALVGVRWERFLGPRDLVELGEFGEESVLRVDLRTGAWIPTDESLEERLSSEDHPGPSYIEAYLASARAPASPSRDGSYELRLEEQRGGTTRSEIVRGLEFDDELAARASVAAKPLVARIERWAGNGFLLRVDERSAYFDPYRRLVCTHAQLRRELATEDFIFVWIREGNWLLSIHSPRERVLSYDPRTHNCSEPLGFEAADDRLGILVDGRFVVLRDGKLILVDPDTAATAPLSFADGWEDEIRSAGSGGRRDFRRLDAEDPPVLRIWGNRWTGLARLDLATCSLVRAADSMSRIQHLLACPDRDHAIVQEDRCIAMLRFGSDERVILFPRE